MAKLIDLSINVSKVEKAKLIEGKKGVYLNLTISVNDEKDDYGNDVSCWQGQTKEERESGGSKNYLGNGKVFWSNENAVRSAEKTINKEIPEKQDDLPF